MTKSTLPLAALLFLCACDDGTKSASAATARTDPISRGKYLVTVTGCDDCHTPKKLDPKLGIPVPDTTRLFAGHLEGTPGPEAKPGAKDEGVIGPAFTSFRLPFGTVYASNLTPDPETGIGRWQESTFVASMRTGHHMGIPTARPILPPMPWMHFAQMTDEDLKATFAYLRSLPPIKNAVPPPEVPPDVLQDLGKKFDAMRAQP